MNGRTNGTSRVLRAMTIGMATGIAGLTGVAGTASAQSATSPAKNAKFEAYTATIIFHSGKVLEGTVTGETPTKVKVKANEGGIAFETEFDRKEILKISRKAAAPAPDAPKNEPASAPAAAKPDAATPPEAADGKLNLYWIDLEGEFGQQITQTPLRKQIKDAQQNKADVIVLYMNADFSENPLEPLPNDANANFDEVFRAEDIVPIFTQEIPREWEKQPRIVMWVRQAMAGASLVPFVIPEIYMHSEGRIGGIGNLTFIFEGVGDDVVREKQRSLRLGHAEGWAIAGGHDYRLIRAMARIEYVLSVRYTSGKPELFEGMPENPGEELLTDDGKDGNRDTLSDVVAGRGDDVLTIDARKGKVLGFSKDTVDTKDDLLVAMGIDRNYRDVAGRAKQIQKQWNDGLENAERTLRRLVEDLGNVRVQPPADYAARTRARGQQKSILNQLKSIQKQWAEALSPRVLQAYDIPPIPQIDAMLDQIEIQQQKDKR